MSLNSSIGELSEAMKTLREHWEQVREVWRDRVADEFESTFWNTLEAQTTAAVRAMDRLSPVLAKALRDCE